MLVNTDKVCKILGMELNEMRKVMVIERKPKTNIRMAINGKELKYIKDYAYLGTNILDNRKGIRWVKILKATPKATFLKHKDFWNSNNSMFRKTQSDDDLKDKGYDKNHSTSKYCIFPSYL